MSAIIAKNNDLIISANDKLLLYNTSTKQSCEIKIPPLELPLNLTKNQQEALKNEKPSILCSNYSKCGKYFAVCTLNKQLVVYNTEKYEAIKNIIIARAVSKIRFTPSCDIVIADKTGDVYLCRKNEEPEQLLGHLSMLLDVIVSENEKYIITCDRDEKIRVSQFPGSYNIESFCLGHEEFVLNLEFCHPEILVSSSGDGTLRFWDFVKGKQLFMINTNDFIKDKNLIRKFCEVMDEETVDVNYLPITCMKLYKKQDKCLIVVSLFHFDGLLIFDTQCCQPLDVKLCQILDLKVLAFDLNDDCLFVLTDTTIQVYKFNNKFVLTEQLDDFYNSCNLINQHKIDISVLYKRKYDNVQEYQDRKKLRIEAKK